MCWLLSTMSPLEEVGDQHTVAGASEAGGMKSPQAVC